MEQRNAMCPIINLEEHAKPIKLFGGKVTRVVKAWLS
jgi:hypothetical protein